MNGINEEQDLLEKVQGLRLEESRIDEWAIETVMVPGVAHCVPGFQENDCWILGFGCRPKPRPYFLFLPRNIARMAHSEEKHKIIHNTRVEALSCFSDRELENMATCVESVLQDHTGSVFLSTHHGSWKTVPHFKVSNDYYIMKWRESLSLIPENHDQSVRWASFIYERKAFTERIADCHWREIDPSNFFVTELNKFFDKDMELIHRERFVEDESGKCIMDHVRRIAECHGFNATVSERHPRLILELNDKIGDETFSDIFVNFIRLLDVTVKKIVEVLPVPASQIRKRKIGWHQVIEICREQHAEESRETARRPYIRRAWVLLPPPVIAHLVWRLNDPSALSRWVDAVRDTEENQLKPY